MNIISPVQNSAILKPQIGAHKKSHFSPAFLFLSSNRKKALETLYAVCRVLDDAVDLNYNEPEKFLADWKRVFLTKKSASVEKYGQDQLAAQFLKFSQEFGISMEPMIDLIDKGVSIDLLKNRYETALDSEAYCYGVAGTVGLACLPIFGVPMNEAKNYAVRLGIAIQWINTIRDVGVDSDMNRIYLPKDHMDKYGYSEEDLLAHRETEAYQALMKFEAQVARGHFQRAEQLLPQKWLKELLPARIMGRIYIQLLNKIEKKRFPIYRKKVKLHTVEKIYATIMEIRK